MKPFILLAVLSLAGCAECQRQPVVCAVAVSTAVISGAIIATDHSRHPEKRHEEPRIWQ